MLKVNQEAIATSLLFLAGVFEFGEGLLHVRNKAHGEGAGWGAQCAKGGDGWLFLQRLLKNNLRA